MFKMRGKIKPMTACIPVLIMLIICSITDIKYRYVDLRVIFICLAVSLLFKEGWPVSSWSAKEFIICFLPGIFMFLTGRIFRGSIGEGDTCLILASGIMAGFSDTLFFLFLGFFFAFLYGIVILLLKKQADIKSLPFVPFLLAGYIVLILR